MSESRLSYADALRARVHDTRDNSRAKWQKQGARCPSLFSVWENQTQTLKLLLLVEVAKRPSNPISRSVPLQQWADSGRQRETIIWSLMSPTGVTRTNGCISFRK